VTADFRALVAQAEPSDLPALAGRLREAEVLLALRLAVPHAAPQPETPERWITPDAAAGIAGISVAVIYSWAKGQRWASRPSRRCLRIEETAFRRWLASKGR
jgi:hypothetical protein